MSEEHDRETVRALNALNKAAGNWAHADAENRELRLLVAEMYEIIIGMQARARVADWLPCTDACPHWKYGECVDLLDDECWFTKRMKELGIEVQE